MGTFAHGETEIRRKRGNWLAVVGCLGFLVSFAISGGLVAFVLADIGTLYALAALVLLLVGPVATVALRSLATAPMSPALSAGTLVRVLPLRM